MSGAAITEAALRSAITDPARPVPPGLTDGGDGTAGRRFNIYRNNVAVSLTEALASGFPCLHALLGAEGFARVAAGFWRRHPPESPVLATYGAALPGYLEAVPPRASMRYLPDVARLELALRAAYHAADAAPVDPATLAAIPPERLADARLRLAAALRMLRSDWPVLSIHAHFLSDGPAPKPGGQDIVVMRPGFDPVARCLPLGGAAFLAALAEGATLGTAQEAALAEVPDFDPAATLSLLIEGAAIVEVICEDRP